MANSDDLSTNQITALCFLLIMELDGGRPSGMVSNWKSGNPWTALVPLDLSKRSYLYSVLTKVM
ncbi:hypothetical protein ACSBR1_012594 [Camellia fascicularis]